MYYATRFFDEFRPGQAIPKGRYDAATVADMVKSGRMVSGDADGHMPDVPLADLTASQLKAKAKDAGIKGYHRMKRETLIARLEGN